MVAFEIFFVVELTRLVYKSEIGCNKKRGVKISPRLLI